MKFSEALLIVKEFFLEVLGFLIPGLVCLFLPLPFLKFETQVTLFSILDEEYHAYAVLLSSYIMGYVVYGASEWKEKFFSTKNRAEPKTEVKKTSIWSKMKYKFYHSYQHDLESQIKSSVAWDIADQLFKERLGSYGYQTPKDYRSLRNLGMSYISEADNAKIYTFTFRADLCRHLCTVFQFYILLGVVIIFCRSLRDYTVFNQISYILRVWIILVIFAYFLKKTRRRFFSIAQRIPFSIFVATATKENAQEDEE